MANLLDIPDNEFEIVLNAYTHAINVLEPLRYIGRVEIMEESLDALQKWMGRQTHKLNHNNAIDVIIGIQEDSLLPLLRWVRKKGITQDLYYTISERVSDFRDALEEYRKDI